MSASSTLQQLHQNLPPLPLSLLALHDQLALQQHEHLALHVQVVPHDRLALHQHDQLALQQHDQQVLQTLPVQQQQCLSSPSSLKKTTRWRIVKSSSDATDVVSRSSVCLWEILTSIT